MDRLETFQLSVLIGDISEFTFQYGQIRNLLCNIKEFTKLEIYIPIWIDQKLQKQSLNELTIFNLHSNMDRLETCAKVVFMLECPSIYIPIWIDQKQINKYQKLDKDEEFTFQYGQIRNEL